MVQMARREADFESMLNKVILRNGHAGMAAIEANSGRPSVILTERV
jgi:hypothetical protein